VTETSPPESSQEPTTSQETTPQPASTYSPLPEPPPPAHAGWAVASLVFFWPLAFSAFTHAFNVYPLWARGDVVAARAASDRVRRLGLISLWLAGALVLLLAIGYTMVLVALLMHGDGEAPHRFHHFHDPGFGPPPPGP